MTPRYPVYIVSKGRAEVGLTTRHLSGIGVPHYVVVEEPERAAYEETRTPLATILTLDPRYQEEYETCDDLGSQKSKGPGAARNFAWEHSIKGGAQRHWVMDDNIDGFFRLNYNLKTPAKTGTVFRAMEDFCDRYENVVIAGPNYFMFAKRKDKLPPFVLNTRIYSCNLIRNDLAFRWRGRYNEDTDLSLQALKSGLVTVQFNAFLQFKVTTQTFGGGCTEAFYAVEGTLPKSEILERMHPDVASVKWKFGRWHHQVDYRPFRNNRLKLRPGVEIPEGTNDYGMVLEVDGRIVPTSEALKL